jgi:Uma2 family endonuclease
MTMSTSTSQPVTTWRPPLQGKWTYADYLHQPDNGFRYEILAGDLYMSPAPSPRHQWAVSVLMVALANFLTEKSLGKVFTSPIDVILDEDTVVQPDLVVLLSQRLGIISETGIAGSPDMLIEVLSPATESLDRRRKFDLYFRHGVREYWIVDVSAQVIEVYVLRGEAYSLLAKYTPGGPVASEVLPGFSIDPARVFTL